MGTPDFAVPSLEKLHNSKHEILAVVTATDKASGRGQKIRYSAVKKYAIKNNISILQPTSLKSESFKNDLIQLNADIFIVVAFKILPKKIFTIPQFGSINAHASLLPKYRGPAPIHWAIYNGEIETGVTTFQIDKKVDTGTILLQKKVEITEKDNVGSMYEKLKYLSADALMETIENIEFTRIDQEDRMIFIASLFDMRVSQAYSKLQMMRQIIPVDEDLVKVSLVIRLMDYYLGKQK